jgi:hypothetical protein
MDTTNLTKVKAHTFSAQKQNEKTRLERYYCKRNDCPLLKRGECIHLGFLSSCVYGVTTIDETKTKRSKSYSHDLQQLKELSKDFPNTKSCRSQCLEYIGDYIYLPYSHMDMSQCQLMGGTQVPFVRNSSLFINGVPFLQKDLFTPEMVVNICQLRPTAIIGGEITSYQKEVIPLFLLHLQLKDKKLFKEATKLDPSILSKTKKLDDIKHIDCTYGDIKKAFIYKDEISSPNVQVKISPTKFYNIDWQEDDLFNIWGEWSGLVFLSDIESTNNHCEIFMSLGDKTPMRVFDEEMIVKLLESNPSLYGGCYSG